MTVLPERCRDGPGHENGHVGNQPFHAVFAEQANPIAHLNAGVDQSRGAG